MGRNELGSSEQHQLAPAKLRRDASREGLEEKVRGPLDVHNLGSVALEERWSVLW